MNADDVNSSAHILDFYIRRALIDAVRWIEDMCAHRRSKPQEPDYVTALSTIFAEDLFNILAELFPAYDFAVSSVYCHQKPIVDIGLGKKPELGDILFVYADRRSSGEKVLNSLLLQAKISNAASLKIHHDERNQLELYKKWPEFTYFRAGALNGEKRNILPKTINDGAQYLLIDNNPLTNGTNEAVFNTDMFPMACSVPDDILYVNNSLSEELIDFLKFKSGRTFDSNPCSTEDGWSKMIWDLLKIAASSSSRRRNAYLGSFPRRRNFYTETMSGMTLLDEALGGDREREEEFSESDGESVGVSVVLIESQLKRGHEERALR